MCGVDVKVDSFFDGIVVFGCWDLIKFLFNIISNMMGLLFVFA